MCPGFADDFVSAIGNLRPDSTREIYDLLAEPVFSPETSSVWSLFVEGFRRFREKVDSTWRRVIGDARLDFSSAWGTSMIGLFRGAHDVCHSREYIESPEPFRILDVNAGLSGGSILIRSALHLQLMTTVSRSRARQRRQVIFRSQE